MGGCGTVAAMLHIASFETLAQVEMVSAGQWLRQRGVAAETVLFLDSGRVALGLREGEVLRHHVGVVEGPMWLDAAFALAARSCSVDMWTETPVRLRRVSVGAFRQGVAAMPAPVAALVYDLAKGYCQQTALAVSRLTQDAEARCAQWLLHHAQPGDQGAWCVTLHQRKRSIAAQLGIAPETLSRVLRQLRDQGWIAGQGKVLQVLQPQALQQVAGL